MSHPPPERGTGRRVRARLGKLVCLAGVVALVWPGSAVQGAPHHAAAPKAAAPPAPPTPPPPWLHTFQARRVAWVAPDATGDGASAEHPMSLGAAVARATAGDLTWLAAGRYVVGELLLAGKGTREAPIVWRGAPGARVTLVGKVAITGPYNWVWGVEVTDPDGTQKPGGDHSGSFYAGAPGVHLINNLIHDTWQVGIGGWQSGPDHVYYGNVVFKVGKNPDVAHSGYPIYTQSRYDTDGLKYIVQNLFLDARNGGPGYAFHGYTEKGYLTGFYLAEDVIAHGRFLIGGRGEPQHHDTIESSFFYDTAPELGFNRPVQIVFRNNYLGYGPIAAYYLWGAGCEGRAGVKKPLPNVITGNTVIRADQVHMRVRTVGYRGGVRVDGVLALDPQDEVDDNVYAGTFRGELRAADKVATLDLDGWRRETAAAGRAFDTRSRVVPLPTTPHVAVLANAYEPGRGFLVIYNWGHDEAVPVDISTVVPRGASYRITPAREPFGPATVEGTVRGPVIVPLPDRVEFDVFLVTLR